MLLDPSEPSYWIIAIAVGLLGLIINLLLIYMVIRLAITHGMLLDNSQTTAASRFTATTSTSTSVWMPVDLRAVRALPGC